MQIRKMMIIALILFGVTASAAATQSEGKVAKLWTNNKVWVTLDSMGSGYQPIVCNTTNRYVVDASTAKGQNILAVLLTASTSGKEVQIVGTDDCNVHQDSESISYVIFQ